MSIEKDKFICKAGMSINNVIIFIKDKEYCGEYETWSWSRGYEVNGGWKRYWVIGEDDQKHELSRAEFRAVFHQDTISDIRNIKIDRILNR